MSEPRVVTNANGSVMTITSILPERETRKKNVAAYARVSTLNEEQEESFESQVAYYTAYIGNNPEWHFVKVYADNGRSGLSAVKRPGFMQMIADAEAGGIDISPLVLIQENIFYILKNVSKLQVRKTALSSLKHAKRTGNTQGT